MARCRPPGVVHAPVNIISSAGNVAAVCYTTPAHGHFWFGTVLAFVNGSFIIILNTININVISKVSSNVIYGRLQHSSFWQDQP